MARRNPETTPFFTEKRVKELAVGAFYAILFIAFVSIIFYLGSKSRNVEVAELKRQIGHVQNILRAEEIKSENLRFHISRMKDHKIVIHLEEAQPKKSAHKSKNSRSNRP